MESATVTATGRPSGMIDIASAMATSSVLWRSPPAISRGPMIATTASIETRPSVVVKRLSRLVNGGTVASACIAPAICPNSVRVPVSVTSPEAVPARTRVPAWRQFTRSANTVSAASVSSETLSMASNSPVSAELVDLQPRGLKQPHVSGDPVTCLEQHDVARDEFAAVEADHATAAGNSHDGPDGVPKRRGARLGTRLLSRSDDGIDR